ncbi:DNA-3-methyladenine glycosylase I, partial [Mesorhizobium sp. M1C.F.Ca.ET.176.01.1.1]|uniref:DNA-3-methyladenine glycosylase I n=1 Tax=Mesorhizobium sp. M1C.F.Ca.ET.176.01.1.1 TaxID=2563922 RepID=UPI001AED2D18
AQAGLSWSTILNKRAGYRRAFDNFDIDKVARFTPKRVETLVADESIVRHRGKGGTRGFGAAQGPSRLRHPRAERRVAERRPEDPCRDGCRIG